MDFLPDNVQVPLFVQVLAGILSALGIGKGSEAAYKRYRQKNGGIREPLTRDELHDELEPLLQEQRDSTEAIGRLASVTKAYHSWMKGYMEGQRK